MREAFLSRRHKTLIQLEPDRPAIVRRRNKKRSPCSCERVKDNSTGWT